MRGSKTFGLLTLLLLCFCGGACLHSTAKVRIAAGSQGTVVYRLGSALADVFNRNSELRASVVDTGKTRNSLAALTRGDAEVAIAFSDADAGGDIRTLVPMYELYLYMIVWEDAGIKNVPDLANRRLGLGPTGSGTDGVARRVLQHYDFDLKSKRLENGGYRALSARFLKRELDAVFLLGSIESKAVERMLKAPGTKLLSLDDPERIAPAMDGIRSKYPFVVSHVIPKHLFGGKPAEPTGVIGVNALLVARSDLPEATARALTRSVFEQRVALGRRVRRLRELTERFDRKQLRFPLHPGAAQYYRRDEPPAIFQWAETISLGITVVLLGWSSLAAFAARRRRRNKTMLDELYADFQHVIHSYDEEHETPPDLMTDVQLADIRERLHALRRRAFTALMEGELEANNAFVVFNDYLRWELQEIERIQRERRLDMRSEGARPSEPAADAEHAGAQQ